MKSLLLPRPLMSILALALFGCEGGPERAWLDNAADDAGHYAVNGAARALGHCSHFSDAAELSGTNLQAMGPIVESMGEGLPADVDCDPPETAERKTRHLQRPTAAQVREALRAAARASPRF